MQTDFLKKDPIMSRHYIIFAFAFGSLAADPVITSINPLTGPSSGSTAVTILGSGFTDATAVSFGDAPATSFDVLSDSEITAVSPGHAPEVVSITVTSGTEASSYYVYQGNWQVYVANGNDATISIINSTTNLVNDLIFVGYNPSYIIFTPDGKTALVTNEADSGLTPINSVTAIPTSLFPTGGVSPNPMVVSPDSSVVYVANSNDGVISALQISDGTSLWTYATGGNPSTLAITSDGSLLGITDTAANKVIFLNTTRGALNNEIASEVSPDCIVLNSATTTAYVTNNNSQSVSVISPYTGSSATLIDVGNNPTALALTPDAANLYVVNATDNTVYVIDTTSNTVEGSISTGLFPKNILITPDGTKAYVTNNASSTVTVIDTNAKTTTTVSVGSNPYAIGILPDGSKVYIANCGDGSISIINTTNDRVVATPLVQVFPSSIGISPDQAPLALFSYEIGLPGYPTTFDASTSASPTGTITNYSWDFGDGVTVETSEPTTSHLYTTSGTYEVRLTVTNSAGTSTEKIFNHASSRNFNHVGLTLTQSETISHNGGPTATTTQSFYVIAAPLPPRDLQGRSIKNIFLTETDLVNALSWRTPQGGAPPILYRIYRDSSLTNLIGTVAANGPLQFFDHNLDSNAVYLYYVVSVSQSGEVSTPASVTVKSN